MEDFFNDWPCLKCIVRAICQKNCEMEISWYEKLDIKDKSIYLRSEQYNNLPGQERLQYKGEHSLIIVRSFEK